MFFVVLATETALTMKVGYRTARAAWQFRSRDSEREDHTMTGPTANASASSPIFPDNADHATAVKGQDAPQALGNGEFPVPPNGKLTSREKKWIVYDVGNSAFVLLSTAVIPIYAKSLMPADGNIVSAWGYAQTIASLVIALLMPLLGSIADVQGMKIKFFLGFFGTGVVMCCAMALPLTWLPFLIIYVLATIGLNGSLTFYDSMLIDTTSNDRMDKVSSHGYGWGYVGSTVPFIVCIALIFGGPALFGWSTTACTRASFVITAVWWVAFTIPLLTSYRQEHYRATREHTREAVRGTFTELAGTLGKLVQNKSLWMFMVAFFFYIDAVNTVISMSTSYGTQLGIDSTQLVIALLVTQFVAFPCAIIYGRLAGRFGCKPMIMVAVVAYMGIVFFATFFLKEALEFWILAILVGMFQGGIQALSRSYYGKIIPKEHANEYYGLYDIFGKTASILGTFLVATTTTLTGNASLGVLSIAILLVVALVFLTLQKDPTRQ
ncbi:MFS transporter [Bifidobacterium tissieri]|uniref:MFS transporter n=3 Tax=Bifidobacterium TaxID=1678 RepID=A0A261FJW4_9BIFI|nr:MFS transporter [Bifidobacterium tissieri]